MTRFWEARTEANVRTYAEAIIRAAADDGDLRNAALNDNLITIEQALRMPGALLPLLQLQRGLPGDMFART